jgi:hypothetical protein
MTVSSVHEQKRLLRAAWSAVRLDVVAEVARDRFRSLRHTCSRVAYAEYPRLSICRPRPCRRARDDRYPTVFRR